MYELRYEFTPTEAPAGRESAHAGRDSHRLWDCWSFRYETTLDTGVTPRPGPAEAVDRPKAAGRARVHLATITGSQRRFTVFLAEDLTRCIACV
ncbi:hypothetical protein ACIOHS_11565 [Streptomyces sp. NPDC088253]|uniref:hypothetical protein n=1 Tax=Streptomyces sp. NPDC088253 TaxID=3365846 RepID=UPI00380C05B9